MGLLYDQRFFSFGDKPLSWEALTELPLGMLTSGMHFRQSIDHNFHSRGLDPPTAAANRCRSSVATSGARRAVLRGHALDGGLEALTEHLRLQPHRGCPRPGAAWG